MSRGLDAFLAVKQFRKQAVDLLSQFEQPFRILLRRSLFAQPQEVLFIDRHNERDTPPNLRGTVNRGRPLGYIRDSPNVGRPGSDELFCDAHHHSD